MKTERIPKRVWVVIAMTACLLGGAITVGELAAQSENVNSNGRFELGDGNEPLNPGVADISGSLLQDGPDWDDLFDADRSLKDELNEYGRPGSNGVPDFLDAWGGIRTRRDIAFVSDPVGDAASSMGDLGNAYAYTLFNDALQLTLYAGIERLPSTTTSIVVELNREVFSVGAGGQNVGDRAVNDVRLSAVFVAGALDAVLVDRWALIDAQNDTYGWESLVFLPASPEQSTEQCNGPGTACVVCNGTSIDGGPWNGGDIAPDGFLELGVNMGALFGADTYQNYYSTRYRTLQVSTTEDSALALFVRAGSLTRDGGAQ